LAIVENSDSAEITLLVKEPYLLVREAEAVPVRDIGKKIADGVMDLG
jgi:hypothetical protein